MRPLAVINSQCAIGDDVEFFKPAKSKKVRFRKIANSKVMQEDYFSQVARRIKFLFHSVLL